MEIRGRTVEAVRYGGKPLYTVHVRQKEGDCRRKQEPEYKCMDNCEGSLIVARLLEDKIVSIKALVPDEVKITIWSPDTQGITTLEDMEALVESISGYRLVEAANKSKVLYFADIIVGYYNPCGFASNDLNLYGDEINHTMNQFVKRIKEVHAIAKDVPMEALVQDKAIAHGLNNPILEIFMKSLGKEGEKILRFLRQKKNEQN
ncbi:hypothetical protein KY335_03990 [Candidatus Woesearchaeota archaeon]|nr:hypothetical protein [Candidatus Woesearchaeota archaeon]